MILEPHSPCLSAPPFSPSSISISWTQKNPKSKPPTYSLLQPDPLVTPFGVAVGAKLSLEVGTGNTVILEQGSSSKILGARKNGEKGEEQDTCSTYLVCFRFSQIAALSPLKEQLPVKLTSDLILHSLQTSKNTPFLSRNFSQSPKPPTEWGNFRQASAFWTPAWAIVLTPQPAPAP